MARTNKFEDISTKLHEGLNLSYRRMIEDKVRKGEPVILGTPDGKVVTVDATEVLERLNSTINEPTEAYYKYK
jgi:hypothetical protein